jgi:hypothetical protein
MFLALWRRLGNAAKTEGNRLAKVTSLPSSSSAHPSNAFERNRLGVLRPILCVECLARVCPNSYSVPLPAYD